ncbi:dolichyl-phosphate-mannose-protein mannosyltransferase [Algoriphagus boseongensis]|uniref:Dolichyl-phosphate-mannose-protein mannosyltransferase n=1 Tax=Algoriphagus boseongensis TaxID=1442587 RepID=A0A4R6T457_9BACT|nr:glycosyltransferase family 39 protein [Algoriphagus boseongensis]TDQ16457.1 dolichyl-phosphate-mannose-protein mannosyltransferase [Algoriphagus boseongensis]
MKKGTYLLFVFILAKFALQYLAVHPDYDLQRDEFLHLDQAKHLAWGYLSVPPFTSWNSVVIDWLGGGEFWVRFFPAFYGVLTLLLVWDLVKRIGGGLFAQSLSAIFLLCSAMIRVNLLYQPNSMDILCWTLAIYSIIRWDQNSNPKWLYLLGLAFGIGMLNKYSIAFLGLGMMISLLLFRIKVFKNKHFYGGLALAFLLFLPNLIWQITHGFPVLTHMRLLQQNQLVNNSPFGFLMEQALFFYPSMLLIIPGWIVVWFSNWGRPYRWVLFSSFLTLAILAFFQAKGYYALGLYPILLGLAALGLEKVTEAGWIKKLRPLAVILPVLLFLPAFNLIHPTVGPEKILVSPPNYAMLGLNRWEDGKEYPLPQDFADMLGWSELGGLVDKAVAQVSDPGRILVLCGNYGEAGAINFYSKTAGLEAFTMNADYLYWFDLEQPIRHLILVRVAEEPLTEREKEFFESYTEIGSVSHPLAREAGTTVYLLQNAKGDVNSILQQEINEEKKLWERDSKSEK